MNPFAPLIDSNWYATENFLLAIVGVGLFTLWLVLWLARNARPARIRQNTWYERRCQVLSNRHQLNAKEQEALYRRQAMEIKRKQYNRYY